jgi:hypothetical protein
MAVDSAGPAAGVGKSQFLKSVRLAHTRLDKSRKAKVVHATCPQALGQVAQGKGGSRDLPTLPTATTTAFLFL